MLFHFPFFYKRSAIFSQSIQYFSLISQRSFFSTKNISTNFNFDTSTSSTLILLFKTTKIYILTKKKKKKSNSITFSQIISTNQFRDVSIPTFLILAKEKKIKFILDLFLPKFHRFPPDYFYESISRDNPIPYPLFRVLWIHTHTHTQPIQWYAILRFA